MLRTPRVMTSVLVLSIGTFVADAGLSLSAAQAQAASQPDAKTLWADFAHYVMIARPELAGQAAAELSQLPAGVVLDAVEASRYDPTNIFPRTQRMEAIAEVSRELETQIQQARITRSREEDRIAADIDRLSQGARAYGNALERLSAAGQFAAPQMLAALKNDARSAEHPQIMKAMVDIGRSMVAPLSTALPQLQPVTQTQVARVLAEIGYPQALPALKRLIENPDTDSAARETAVAAFNRLADNNRRFVDGNPSAAQLYLALGRGYYATATESPASLDAFDLSSDTGVLWRYDPKLTITGGPGLLPVVVPGQVIGDVLAMDAAETALQLNADLDPALSLFLTANLRRENRMPEGVSDPSYAASRQPASFYALAAGPTRLRDVLDRALQDGDVDLALDAISGLSATASLEALQPLVRGLGYPNRNVRFRAAEALARAMPKQSFSNDFRVVPVLAESLRESGSKVALVISAQQATTNQIVSQLASLGFNTVDATSVDQATGMISDMPAVDLLVVYGSGQDIRAAVAASQENYKLAAAPVVAIAQGSEQPRLASLFENNPRVTLTSGEDEALKSAIDLAGAQFSGPDLDGAAATDHALSALRLLRDIALGQTVYNVQDALPSLVTASTDPRAEVAMGAGNVLSRIDAEAAQSALAVAATQTSGETQAALLRDLADSANSFGNLIAADLSDEVLNLVKTTQGDVAIAAAQAHGALSLPTRNAVDLILAE